MTGPRWFDDSLQRGSSELLLYGPPTGYMSKGHGFEPVMVPVAQIHNIRAKAEQLQALPGGKFCRIC